MSLVKLKKALAITVAALQIPLLMLWKIMVDTVRSCSSELMVTQDPSGETTFELVFQWEKFWEMFPYFLPVSLVLAECFVLSVVGLVLVLRQKRVTVTTACFYGVTFLACGFLCLAFARPASVLGTEIAPKITLHEFMFYRYFCGLEWRFNVDRFPLLEAIKFLLLGLCMAASGVLCGLGITEAVQKKKTPPLVTEAVEPELYQVQGRRKTE